MVNVETALTEGSTPSELPTHLIVITWKLSPRFNPKPGFAAAYEELPTHIADRYTYKTNTPSFAMTFLRAGTDGY